MAHIAAKRSCLIMAIPADIWRAFNILRYIKFRKRILTIVRDHAGIWPGSATRNSRPSVLNAGGFGSPPWTLFDVNRAEAWIWAQGESAASANNVELS